MLLTEKGLLEVSKNSTKLLNTLIHVCTLSSVPQMRDSGRAFIVGPLSSNSGSSICSSKISCLFKIGALFCCDKGVRRSL